MKCDLFVGSAIHIHGWRCAQKVVFTLRVNVTGLIAPSLLLNRKILSGPEAARFCFTFFDRHQGISKKYSIDNEYLWNIAVHFDLFWFWELKSTKAGIGALRGKFFYHTKCLLLSLPIPWDCFGGQWVSSQGNRGWMIITYIWAQYLVNCFRYYLPIFVH